MSTVHPKAGREGRFAHQLLVTGAGLWCASVALGPILGFEPVYAFFSVICHQMPDRSWFIGGAPLAACIRCASIYLGFFLALTLRIPANLAFLKIAVSATLLEFFSAQAGLDYQVARSVTGLLLGGAAAGFVEAGVSELIRTRIGRFHERTS